jgi:guanylate kinase
MAGILFVLSGPSGAGKGTILEKVMERDRNITFSVSATTRKPRVGEVEGTHYFFKERAEFQDMIRRDDFLEWAPVHDEFYGTPRKEVYRNLKIGYDVVLDIDVQGALQLREKGEEGIYIFIAPPHIGELKKRLMGRGTESEEKILRRIEVAKKELTCIGHYDYLVINDRLEDGLSEFSAILLAERCRTARRPYDGINERQEKERRAYDRTQP